MNAGVKSTAVLFGNKVKEISSLFATLFVVALFYAGLRNGQGVSFFVVSVGGAIVHCLWQLSTLNPDDDKDCLNKFIVGYSLLDLKVSHSFSGEPQCWLHHLAGTIIGLCVEHACC